MIPEHSFSTLIGMSLALDELSTDIIFLLSGVVQFLMKMLPLTLYLSSLRIEVVARFPRQGLLLMS